MKNHTETAFTLVELLTVVAIIIILSAILMSVFSRATAESKKTRCISHLRTIGQSLEIYTSDNNGQLPDNIYVNYNAILPYANKAVFICPMDHAPYVNLSSQTRKILPTSYFPIPTIAEGFYEELKEKDDNHTTFVCLLHGNRATVIQSALTDTSGTVLRLRKDTSVKSVNVFPKCWTNPEGASLVGRDWWHVFTDEKPSQSILEEVLGIKYPEEVVCQ